METAFVVMPINDATSDRWKAIEEGIAENTVGLAPSRADLDSHAFIIEGILRAIDNATVVVADLSPTKASHEVWLWNPNVMFELGYAIAKGKAICLVCEKANAPSRFPFDIAHQRVFLFEETAALRQHLKEFDFLQESGVHFAGAVRTPTGEALQGAGSLMLRAQSRAAEEAQDYFLHLRQGPDVGSSFARWLGKRTHHEQKALADMERDIEKVPTGPAKDMVAFAIGTQKVKLQFYETLTANIDENQRSDDIAWWLARAWSQHQDGG